MRADRRHYEHDVKPFLDRRHARLIGEVDGPQKDEFLRTSAALLFPIRWPEPFGLVMVEAMACGTPVIAFRQGSVPEIVEHGVTGFICDDEDDMVAAIERIVITDSIRPFRINSEIGKNLKIIDTTNLFAQAIRRIHQEDSISDLLS